MSTEQGNSPKTVEVEVFIFDQNHFFRHGIREALSQQQGIRVSGDSSAADEEVCDIIHHKSPQVVIIGLSGGDAAAGARLIRRIVGEFPGTKPIALTSRFDSDELARTVAAGASAYLCKDIEVDALAGMIRRVARGELPIVDKLISEPANLTNVIRHLQSMLPMVNDAQLTDSPITARETDVLTHVAYGYGNKQIASMLSISEQTIKNHMAAILKKMAANDRTHAVVKAMRHGWITA